MCPSLLWFRGPDSLLTDVQYGVQLRTESKANQDKGLLHPNGEESPHLS